MENTMEASSQLRIVDDDFQLQFEVDWRAAEQGDNFSEEVSNRLAEIEQKLSANSTRIRDLDVEIDRLTNYADVIDNLMAIGSGVLSGIVDSLWVGEFSFEQGKAWSNKTVNDFVMKVAKSKGYTGGRLDGAIKFLEDKFSLPSDSIWKGKDIGVSAKSHHIDDLAHHPTPVGLFFSILTQFTDKGYFQNRDGHFFPIQLNESNGTLLGTDTPSKIFAGTVNWFFHLVSDMSGSNKTAGVGMGVPGPIVSLLKEISTIPGLDKTDLARKVNNIFVKEKFDLRSELAAAHELTKQAVPVLMNEVIVRAVYFIRRLLMELKEQKSLEKVVWKRTLPWKNRTIARMLTIATGTFTLVDLADAAIRGAIKAGGQSVDLREFILRVNFIGFGRFAIAVSVDASMDMNRDKLRNERMAIISEQLHLHNAKFFYLQAGAWVSARTTAEAINEAAAMMNQSALIFVESWNANQISLVNIGEYRSGIEEHNPALIKEISNILK